MWGGGCIQKKLKKKRVYKQHIEEEGGKNMQAASKKKFFPVLFGNVRRPTRNGGKRGKSHGGGWFGPSGRKETCKGVFERREGQKRSNREGLLLS